MPILKIPTPLRPYAGGNVNVEVQGDTVGKALDNLVETYPQLQKHLFKDDGELRQYVNLFLREEDIRHLGGMEVRLNEGDEIMIIPSIAGGSLVEK
jgi:adenylyltransferase/sulfurtransferase